MKTEWTNWSNSILTRRVTHPRMQGGSCTGDDKFYHPARFQWFLGDFYNSSLHLYLFLSVFVLGVCLWLCIRVCPESASWLAIYLRVFVFVCPASWLAINLRAASQLLPQSRRSCHHYTKHYNITPSTQSAHTWPLKLTLWNKVYFTFCNKTHITPATTILRYYIIYMTYMTYYWLVPSYNKTYKATKTTHNYNIISHKGPM